MENTTGKNYFGNLSDDRDENRLDNTNTGSNLGSTSGTSTGDTLGTTAGSTFGTTTGSTYGKIIGDSEFSSVLSASSLEGTSIINSKDENLGDIKDIMIDLYSGNIAYVVVSFGGFLGMGNKLFAMPWEAFTVDERREKVIVDIDKSVLENAPGFDKDNWPKNPSRDFISQVHSHYGYKPYWERDRDFFTTRNTSDKDTTISDKDTTIIDDRTSTIGSTTGSSYDTGNYGTAGSSTSRSRMLTGMFRDRESAERAYNSLQSRGYSKDDVNLIMSDETRKKHFSKDHDHHDSDLGNKAMEGAGVGSAIGGTLGAIVGAIAAVGTSVALPGLGLVIAGPIAAGLAGAGAGGLTGGVLGALVGSGIPEDRAKEYESDIKEGGIVMGVNPRSEEDATYFENEWRNSRGERIYR